MNALLGEERAIVTEIAGTTRDILEEQLHLDGVNLNILDTAGIRQTQDIVEQIGVNRAKEQAESADLILYVVDSSCALDESDKEILAFLHNKKSIILLNKSDLLSVVTEEMIQDQIQHPVVTVSAKSGHGLKELEEIIRDLFFREVFLLMMSLLLQIFVIRLLWRKQRKAFYGEE